MEVIDRIPSSYGISNGGPVTIIGYARIPTELQDIATQRRERMLPWACPLNAESSRFAIRRTIR